MEYKNWSAWSLCLPLGAPPHPWQLSVSLSVGSDPPEVLTFFPGFSNRMDSPRTMQWVNLLAQIPRPRSRSLSGTLPGTLKIDIPHCHTLSSHCVILEYTSGVQPDDRSLLLDASHSMLSTGQSLVSLPIPLSLSQHRAICQGAPLVVSYWVCLSTASSSWVYQAPKCPIIEEGLLPPTQHQKLWSQP